MILRNSLSIFSVIILAFFTLVSCIATTKVGDFNPIAVPYSYSFTKMVDNSLTLRLFVGSKDSRFINPDNYSRLEIRSGNERLEAVISGEIWGDDVPLGQINNRNVYMVTVPLTLGGGSGFEISDAYLNIRWRNGETDKLYIGDISFVLADSPLPKYDEITFCALNSIGGMWEKDTYHLPAFELRIRVNRDILLTKVDLGLSKYGIDNNNILHFNQDDDIGRIAGAIISKSIFENYPSHFSLGTTNDPSYEVSEVLLTEGDNLLILPLVSSDINYNTIVHTGAKLSYSIDGVEKSVQIPQKLLFSQVFWTTNSVKELAKDVRN